MTYNELYSIQTRRCDMVLDIYRDIVTLKQEASAPQYKKLYNNINAILVQVAQLNEFETAELSALLPHKIVNKKKKNT